jgi:hypothetical protein
VLGRLLAALDKPRNTNSMSAVVHPGGSTKTVQLMLLEMREKGSVKFYINKGLWSRA